MKERPILMSGPEMRALLAGTKTQTRRLVKIEDGKVRLRSGERRGAFLYLDFDGVPCLSWRPYGGAPTQPFPNPQNACHYGVPGDRLWVRETWLRPFAPRAADSTGPAAGYIYRADGPEYLSMAARSHSWGAEQKWRPSIFMPRSASRITLEVTEVRVQRLQEITNEDARAEGAVTECESKSGDYHGDQTAHLTHGIACHRGAFADLWGSINGKRAPWASNPWVWAITFRRLS